MKSLGGELMSLAATMAIPAAVALIFPYGATSFRAAGGPAPAEPSAAFVDLSAAEEAAATRAAKASWQGSGKETLSIRPDLSFGELPRAREPAMLDVEARTRPASPSTMEWKDPPYLPRLAAPPPPPMPPEPPPADELPFPRDKLLRLGNLGLGIR